MNLLTDLGMDDEGDDDPVPLPNVNAAILKKVQNAQKCPVGFFVHTQTVGGVLLDVGGVDSLLPEMLLTNGVHLACSGEGYVLDPCFPNGVCCEANALEFSYNLSLL